MSRTVASRWPRWLVACVSLFAVAGGVLTLVGWLAEIPRLTDWKADGISMFPNAAVCAILTGLALLAHLRTDGSWRMAARLLPLPVLALGTITFVEHLTSMDFGIDRALVDRPWGQTASASPMRMGPPASMSFAMLGLSAFLLGFGPRARRAAVVLGVVVLLVSTLSLIGHLYRAEAMYTLPRLTGIAMQTAVIIFGLALGILAGVPERQPLRVMLDRGAAGILARRALPLVVLLAVTLGWVRVELQRQGLVDMAFGTALRTVFEIVLLTGLLWRALKLIREHEQALQETTSEVRRQAGQLAAFLDTAAIALHRAGPDGTILWANDAELRAFGYARDEYVGHNLAEFHDDPGVAADLLARLHAGENVREYPARIRHRDGSVREVLIDSSVLRHEGRFLHTQSFTRDVTEQRRAEASRALHAAIVEASEDAILSKTLDGIITSWNSGAERMFGYTADEVLGRPVDLILPPDRFAEERDILARLRGGQGVEHYETVRRRKDGALIDVSLSVSPVRGGDGTIQGASIARDITERKQAEREREEASRRKDEFIAILAHELRNPLAPVRNAAHYLRSLALTEVQRPVAMIERQIAQMARLIDDLLDVSRISRGVLELRRERVSCAEIVEAAVEACRPELTAKKHTLVTKLPDGPVEIEADRERMVQVISNLLVNSAKYTPSCGHIELEVSARGKNLRISLKDDGIGIPPDRLSEIFELFTRIDSTLEKQGGLGIGLTLARQIAELHGGRIEARSEGIGCGSEFLVELPVIAEAPLLLGAPEAEPKAKVQCRRIVVADDNEDAAESLAMLLRFEGHDVHTAFDGEQAFDAVEALRPDLALLDIGMPKANGYEVARRIRAQPWGDAVQLVALTGWGQDADRRRASDAGFDLHLVKPVSSDALDEVLRSLPGSGEDDDPRAVASAAS